MSARFRIMRNVLECIAPLQGSMATTFHVAGIYRRFRACKNDQEKIYLDHNLYNTVRPILCLALKGRNSWSGVRSAVRSATIHTARALKGRNILAMGQSLVKNYIHIVFSTKYRQPLIHPSIEAELYSYLGGICNSLDCTPIKIGGHYDHVHILCFLSKKIALMKLVEELKSHSSSWMKTKSEKLQKFYWQNGYGAFSVKPSEVDIVKGYIENQHEHHAKAVFQDEYRELLKEHEADFDERYVWD